MRLLLDTHIFIWIVSDDPKLSSAAWSMIETAAEVYVSSASIWEATIKFQLGKLALDPDRLVANVVPSGFLDLPITSSHAAAVRRLPPIHRDPFDRLLIAQSMCEPLHLVTADERLAPYSDLVRFVKSSTR